MNAPVVCRALVIAAACASTTGVLGQTAEAARTRILVTPASSDAGVRIVRPSSVRIVDFATATNLLWSGWGRRVASANGRSGPTRARTTYRVVAYRARLCGPYIAYTRIRITYRAAAHDGIPARTGSRRAAMKCDIRFVTPAPGYFAPGVAAQFTVRPTEFLLGDAVLQELKWVNWGKATSTGTGRLVAFDTPPGGLPITVRLSGLRYCRIGAVMSYQGVELAWVSNGEPQRLVPSSLYRDYCNG